MKSLNKDEKGITTVMLILAIVAILVASVAVISLMAPEADDDVDDDDAPVAVAGQQTGPFSMTLVNLAGTNIGNDSNLWAYLTSPDVYTDVYEVFEELDTQGKLVDPYDPEVIAGSRKSSIGTNGVVSFSVTAKQWLAGDDLNIGTDFGIAIIDDDTSVGDYNPEVGKVKINARLTPEQAVVVSIVDGQPGYLGSEVEVAPIGNLSFYDSLTMTDGKTGYTLQKDAGDYSDEDFTINARLLVADTEIRDITTYVEVNDGNISLEVDDVEISVDGVKITGTGMSDISDLSTTNVLKKNAPAKVGDTLYVIEGASFDMYRINDNNMAEVEIELTDYSATIGADGVGSVRVTLVANNGYKTSDYQIGNFTFTLGQNVTSQYS